MRLASILLAGVFMAAPLAHADTFTLAFSESGSGTSGSGILTLTTTADPNVDQITGITGTFSSAAGGFSGVITGLNPGSYSATNPTILFGGNLIYDNLFYPSGASATCDGTASTTVFSYCGLDFIVDGKYEVALFGTGSTYGVLDGNLTGDFYDNNAPITLSIAATPEPSTLALAGTGLLGVAGVLRRRFALPCSALGALGNGALRTMSQFISTRAFIFSNNVRLHFPL